MSFGPPALISAIPKTTGTRYPLAVRSSKRAGSSSLPRQPRHRLRRHRHEPALRAARMFLRAPQHPSYTRECSGRVSLILWSLLLIISVKYLILILRADNRGEGGILALPHWSAMSLGAERCSFSRTFRRGLLYADGMITPAISRHERGRRPECRHSPLQSIHRSDCDRHI